MPALVNRPPKLLKNPLILEVSDLTNGILLSNLKTPTKSVLKRPNTPFTIGVTALRRPFPIILINFANDSAIPTTKPAPNPINATGIANKASRPPSSGPLIVPRSSVFSNIPSSASKVCSAMALASFLSSKVFNSLPVKISCSWINSFLWSWDNFIESSRS